MFDMKILKQFFHFLNMICENNIDNIKLFIESFYGRLDLDDNFYFMLKSKTKRNSFHVFNLIIKKNLYKLISYVKFDDEDTSELENTISYVDYYSVSKRDINKLVNLLKKLNISTNSKAINRLNEINEMRWNLRKDISLNSYECIAYKMILTIGFDNSIELLENRYGEVNYEIIYYMFNDLNTNNKLSEDKLKKFRNYLFGNKKDPNNKMREILNGNFEELFFNFDYFYNNFDYFIEKLGNDLQKNKLVSLLKERLVASNIDHPSITGDISEDMISSYHGKFEYKDVGKQEIIEKNNNAYDKLLTNKKESSIPKINLSKINGFTAEIISLNDPRNLVIGYRTGNCFRLNGDASFLFNNFLSNPHMRILSFNTDDSKDVAMVLIMRNGNVLIAQGIEASNRLSDDISGKPLYDACKNSLKEIMDYMNDNNDEIVATIIGRTNNHVSDYNNNILPFLINPLIDNNNLYNGVSNYQCLLDLKNGKSINDIKLFTPRSQYCDERPPIMKRDSSSHDNYFDIEKILISLRFKRWMHDKNIKLYKDMVDGRHEIYTVCNIDWYITVYDDGFIDSFISVDDENAKDEYLSILNGINKRHLSKKLVNRNI